VKRAAAVLLAAIGIGWLLEGSVVGCVVRGQHDPRRARSGLGGFRCSRCGKPGASLDDFGDIGAGYVSPNRRIFTRDGAGGFAETSRGVGWRE
jgi:hypothetical protein